jgi:DNA-directed RNA polymerase subunit RPC12/RpoP
MDFRTDRPTKFYMKCDDCGYEILYKIKYPDGRDDHLDAMYNECQKCGSSKWHKDSRQ